MSRWAKAAATLVCGATALSGCGGDASPLDGRDLERTLTAAMSRLDGLDVRAVDCVFLTSELTRCFADGTGPEGTFQLPVSVVRNDAEMVWSVAEDDLRDARRGVRPEPLKPGEVVSVEGGRGQRVQVRVREPIDPLDVTYPEVPPQYGNRYVAIPVELRNRGPRTYVDRPLSQINGRLSDGSLVTHAPIGSGDCASSDLSRVRLESGERVRGCVAFEVPDRLELAGVALQLGYGDSVLEWELTQERPAT